MDKERASRTAKAIRSWLWEHWVGLLAALATATSIAMFAATFLSISAYYQLKGQADVNAHNARISKSLAIGVARATHDATQQNIDARFADCTSSEKVRAALRDQVLEGERTSSLLFKLLPSLDTPEVHRLVARERARQLKAYKPRDCGKYAISSVPVKQRKFFTIPPA